MLRASSVASVLDWILWDVSQNALGRIDGFLAVHAGAVSWAGRCLIMPAPPDSGKTTLTAALVSNGYDYLTDEAALINPSTGLVHPFLRPLSLEQGSVGAVPGLIERIPADLLDSDQRLHHLSAEDLRRGAFGVTSRIAWVVAPSYRRGSATTLEPISRAEAVALMARNSLNFTRFGGRGVRVLELATRDASFHRLSVGDLAPAVRLIRRLTSEENGHGG
jgi:hypothetical protein